MSATRRDVLAGATMIFAAPLLPPPDHRSSPGPIAILFKEWEEARAANLDALRPRTAAEAAYFAAQDRKDPNLADYDAAVKAAEAVSDATLDRQEAIERKIARTRATTPHEMMLKATIASTYVWQRGGYAEEPECLDSHLWLSVAEDCKRLAGGAS